jgi:hypothetical protein
MIRMRSRSNLRYRRASSPLDRRRHREDEPAPEVADNEADEADAPDDADEAPDADIQRRIAIVRQAKWRAGRDLTERELERLL